MSILSNLSNKRRYLTPNEVDRLLDAAKKNKAHGHRNSTMILLCYRHGLRCSEAITLQWHQIDLKTGTIDVNRLKNGIPSRHPLTGEELRALKRLRREQPHSRFVFLSQRGTPMTRQNVNVLLAALGTQAGIEVPVTPHMLRHSCGTKLANEGKDTRSLQHFLGHRNIQSTVIYTHMDANRFNDWWQD
jgi:type 1 fimbriae regulatory protein FimB/type 1 fimbriae regulatory protein FimE